MCSFKDNAATAILHYVQLTFTRFLSLNASPSPEALCLYSASIPSPQIYLVLHTKYFVLSRSVSSPTRQNIATVTVRDFCTHIWSLPNIPQSSTYKIILHYLATQSIPCRAFCGP